MQKRRSHPSFLSVLTLGSITSELQYLRESPEPRAHCSFINPEPGCYLTAACLCFCLICKILWLLGLLAGGSRLPRRTNTYRESPPAANCRQCPQRGVPQFASFSWCWGALSGTERRFINKIHNTGRLESTCIYFQ